MIRHGDSDCNEAKSGLVVKIKVLAPDVQVPLYTSLGAAGADIQAWISEPLAILPGKRALISTGLQVEIPVGYEIQVRSRSGLAIKQGLFVVNSPGTIDSDYRGEIKIILGNIGNESITIMPGDRIAQLVVAPVVQAAFVLAEELSESSRGHGGFGSSGL